MVRSAPGSRRAPWLLALPLVWSAACTTPPPLEPDPGLAASVPLERGPEGVAPSWSGRPLSWEKLDAIESWLAANEGRGRSYWTARARLELAEGRLAYAKDDADRSATVARLAAAEQGFRSVLASPGADADLLRRAHLGLREAQRIGHGEVAVASSAGPVVGRAQWGARPARPERLTRNRSPWTRITVHHSARTTASQLGRSTPADVAEALRQIQKVHMDDRDFGDIGYHFLIDPQGRVYEGRSLRWQGAHANGANNIGNIGICLFGNFEEERPTTAALTALERLVGELSTRYRIPRERLYAHRELRPTECPGDNLMRWVSAYRGGLAAATPSRPATARGWSASAGGGHIR